MSIVLHSRLRTNHEIHEFYQARGGAVVQYGITPRTLLIGGYYFVEQEHTSRHLFDQHRGFGGVQHRMLTRRRVRLDGRWLTERYFAGPAPDYWRLRHRLTATLPRDGWTPYVSGEALWVQNARWLGQYTTGVQRRSGSFLLGFGYEFRQSVSGPGSNVITTFFQFDAPRPKR